MYINNLDIPNDIIQAAQEGHLVVFAGAGVSMGAPTSMPDFNTLTEKITMGTGEIKGKDESSEVFLGRINHSGVDVKKRTASILSEKDFIHNDLHKFIIDLFPSAEKIRIVTTNYDKMFEQVLSNKGVSPIKIYDAPALPLGDNFSGIAHIHGNVDDPSTIIITDEDFGQAYMAEGYVSRFLIKLFDSYTVLFIGYSYNDIIVSYLTRAITKNKNQKKYIFVPESSNKWDELGIKPIVYGKGNHSLLNDTVPEIRTIQSLRCSVYQPNCHTHYHHRPAKDSMETSSLFLLSDNRVRFLKKSSAKVRTQMIKEKYQNYTLLKASVDFHRHNEIKGLAQDSMKTYRGYVSKFIEWRGNDTLVSDITTDLLEENAEYKMECGNKAVSMETNIRHLRCFLRFCEKRGMANRIDITIPKYEKELKEPYTDEEMALLLIRPRSDSWTEYRKPERRTD